jgi:site-specific recombinase XerC
VGGPRLGAKPHITVRRSADTRTSTVVSTTKTGKERCVGIGPRTVETLEAHRSRQLLERMAARSLYNSGLVLPNTKGKIRRRDSVVHSLKALLEEAGLPKDVRFHDLRHTAGTLAGHFAPHRFEDARALRPGDRLPSSSPSPTEPGLWGIAPVRYGAVSYVLGDLTVLHIRRTSRGRRNLIGCGA